MATHYLAIAQDAVKDEMHYSDFLERLLEHETRVRHERAREVMLRTAGFPAIKTIEEYESWTDRHFWSAPKYRADRTEWSW